MMIYNPQWGIDFPVDDALIAFMAGHGFAPWHSGGGCFAWHRWAPQFTETAYDLVTFRDGSLGSWAERDEPNWIIGRYDEACPEFIDCTDLTLTAAIEWIAAFDPGAAGTAPPGKAPEDGAETTPD